MGYVARLSDGLAAATTRWPSHWRTTIRLPDSQNPVGRKPNFFGERNIKPNAGGSAVKDDRKGGHPFCTSEGSRNAEDGDGAVPIAGGNP